MASKATPTATLTVLDVPEDCGNAPRKAFVRDFVIALYSKDWDTLTSFLTEKAHWTINGTQTLTTLTEIQEWIAASPAGQELKFSAIITHGRECGVDGVITTADGRKMFFCHMLDFTGATKTARIKEIRSYVAP